MTDEQTTSDTGGGVGAFLRRHPGPVLVLAAALGGGLLWLTAPTAERRPNEPTKPLVTAQELQPRSYHVAITAHGRVEPVTRVALVPQVGGRIVAVHSEFAPGGYVPAGEVVATIDDRDYRAAVRRARADLDEARENLQLEEGRHRAAMAEWEQFRGGATDPARRDLATRGPQLRTARARVDAAAASLEQAELNLERTRIVLPYPVRIAAIDAGVGSLATPGEPLGSAYATHALWIQASMPVERLRWFSARRGDPVTVWPRGTTAPVTGYAREVYADVEPRGSLGRVLVEVPLPTDPNLRPPMHVGEFVRLELRGDRLDNVFVLPRKAVHGDDVVWLADAEGKLRIRPVDVVFNGHEVVVVDAGLAAGERLITSQLSRPVDGMSVRVAGDEPAATATAAGSETTNEAKR